MWATLPWWLHDKTHYAYGFVMQLARRWKVLIVTSLAVFMALMDVTIVNIAFPDMRASFPQASLSDLSWVLNAYNVVFAAALVPAGRMADRVGRKRTFLFGLVVFVVASVACGAAPNVEVLVAARVVQAIGAATIVPISLSLVLPEFPPERRATAVALSTATGGIAAATGPILGGLLVDWQGWRWVFLVNLIIGIIVFVPARRLLRETEKDSDARLPDVAGALLFMAAIAVFALALVKAEDWGWGSVRVIGGIALAVALVVVFLIRSARHPSPVFELGLFRVGNFSVANAGGFGFSVGFYALLLGNVLFLTGSWHYDVFVAGIALTPGAIMATLSAPFAGRLIDRFGARATAFPGGLLFAAGALSLALRGGGEPDYLGVFLPSALLTGLGVGLIIPAFGSTAAAQLPAGRISTGIAIFTCFRQIGAVVGIAALVAVVKATGGYQGAYVLIAVAGLFSAAIALLIRRVPREVGSPVVVAVADQR
jgi:EmrB/QacA subfamily drug resistance transporter